MHGVGKLSLHPSCPPTNLPEPLTDRLEGQWHAEADRGDGDTLLAAGGSGGGGAGDVPLMVAVGRVVIAGPIGQGWLAPRWMAIVSSSNAHAWHGAHGGQQLWPAVGTIRR